MYTPPSVHTATFILLRQFTHRSLTASYILPRPFTHRSLTTTLFSLQEQEQQQEQKEQQEQEQQQQQQQQQQHANNFLTCSAVEGQRRRCQHAV